MINRKAEIMKSSGICPKCNGSQIIFIPGKAGAYGSGNNIEYGFTFFSYIPVERYLCCDCGYSEEYVDRDDIDKLMEKYR